MSVKLILLLIFKKAKLRNCSNMITPTRLIINAYIDKFPSCNSPSGHMTVLLEYFVKGVCSIRVF